VRRLFSPLDDLLTFEEWLSTRPYNEHRKNESRAARSKVGELESVDLVNIRGKARRELLKKVRKIQSFVKTEFRNGCFTDDDEFKEPRGIHAACDLYKARVGPAVGSMEGVVYKLQWLIKHDNPLDKLLKMEGLDHNAKFILSTDYTKFENSFKREIQDACEFQLYKHLLARHPNEFAWLQLQSSDFTAKYKHVLASSTAVRMSGEMTTSLGNSFSNLMLMMFALYKVGADHMKISGVFEGDDGLTCTDVMPDTSVWNDLGFIVKLKVEESVQSASFCGHVYDRCERVLVADPLYHLAKAGYTTKAVSAGKETRDKLTAASGFALLASYASNPILGKLGERMLRSTPTTERQYLAWFAHSALFDSYERANMRQALKHHAIDPSPRSRAIVATVFGVPVDVQLLIEREIDSGSGPIDSEQIRMIYTMFRPRWVKWGSTYSDELQQHSVVRFVNQTTRLGTKTEPGEVDLNDFVVPTLAPALTRYRL